ncbi:MAG: cytidylate kinase-like family protein [Chloroflexi bacterium]|nr:cytidylate kinase-like family protein [Chloroflexota bacterium]
MGGRVVTITEAVGSGAPVVARLVGERLGLPIVDREVLLWAAQQAGVSPDTIEEAERAPSFMERMIESMGVYLESGEPMDPRSVSVAFSGLTNERYRNLIEGVVRNIGDTGEAVIVGHAAHAILRDYPNVFRVYLSAPLATRVARVSEAEGAPLAAAESMVRESDRVRRSFFEDQWKVRRNEAQNYDLCLRTDKLTFDVCAELISLGVAKMSLPAGVAVPGSS